MDIEERSDRESLTSADYARVFAVLEAVDTVRDAGAFPPQLLEALGSVFGFRNTTWFAGSTYATVFADPTPWLTGRITGLLKHYRNGWDRFDVFASRQPVEGLKKTHCISADDLGTLPAGPREYMREMQRLGLEDATALHLRPGGRHALVGIFGPAGTVGPSDRAALRLLGRQLAAIVRHLPGSSAASALLTDLPPRHREVAMLVSDGLTNSKVARTLALSEDTVKKYVSRVLLETGCRSRTELAVRLRSGG